MEDTRVPTTHRATAPTWSRTRLAALFGASTLFLAACGHSSGDDTNTLTPPPPATTDVTVTVIDGAIRNALVCVDQNENGACDAGEPQDRTDASGKVTFTLATGDVGKYPLVASVGTDAVDAVFGPVTAAYTMSAPADHTGVISPLTTLVRQMMMRAGVDSAQAAGAIQAVTGITSSLFADYTQAAAANGAANAADVARLWVLMTQAQASALASAVGTQSIDGSTLTQADVNKAAQIKIEELLQDAVTLLADPAITGAATPADKDAALRAAVSNLVATSGLSATGLTLVAAANAQIDAGTVPSFQPAAGVQVQSLSVTDSQTYSVRTLGGTLAQQTPDANSRTRYVERRTRAVNGVVTRWGAGGDPTRGSDLNWNGAAWVACPLNYENTSSFRDAHGNNVYGYCDGREEGTGQRAVIDIAGRPMADVYAQIRAAGYTNLFIANPAALGAATFPAGSVLFLQVNRPTSTAITYLPTGQDSPQGTSNVTTQYGAAVAAGGVAASQPAGTACNAPETATSGQFATDLDAWIATKKGTPCIYGQGSITYNGNTYQSEPSNEWWGQSTVSLGKLGSVPIAPGPNSSGFYTGNTLLRAAFTGPGANAVTYYACKERFVNGSPRNCSVIGTGSYAITQLGDGRALTFNNLPASATALDFTRVFVERGGLVYFGFQSKPTVTSQARLGYVAGNALLAQLGITPDDPDVPLALTAASYQGVWDLRDTPSTVANSIRFVIGPTGAVGCVDNALNVGLTCSLTISDPATGAASGTLVDSDGTHITFSGRFDYVAARFSGTALGAGNPTPATIVGGRR